MSPPLSLIVNERLVGGWVRGCLGVTKGSFSGCILLKRVQGKMKFSFRMDGLLWRVIHGVMECVIMGGWMEKVQAILMTPGREVDVPKTSGGRSRLIWSGLV